MCKMDASDTYDHGFTRFTQGKLRNNDSKTTPVVSVECQVAVSTRRKIPDTWMELVFA